MNFLDIFLLAVVAIFTIRGFFRGLIKEIFSLASVVLGVSLASRYHDLVAPHLKVYIASESTVGVLSYIAVFIIVVVVMWTVARVLRGVISIALLGWLDRLAGTAFGLVEGGILALVMLFFLSSMFPNADFVKNSAIRPEAEPAMQYISDLAPEDIKGTLKEKGISFPKKPMNLDGAIDSVKEQVGKVKEKVDELGNDQ